MPQTLSEPAMTALLKQAAEKVDVDFGEATQGTPLESLGMDSLTQLELVALMEEELSVRIPDEDLKAIQTVGQLVTCLTRLQAAGSSVVP